MNKVSGAYSFAEITSQPTVWGQVVDTFRGQADAFQTLYASRPFDRVLLTGCGSTYYLAQAGAALFQPLLGVNARAYPASEIALLPDLVFLPNTTPLLIAVSRSGETTETLAAVRVFRERTGCPVVAVTCDPTSSLAAAADFTVALPEAQEQSLAQTRSFASMLIVVQMMAALLTGREEMGTLANIGATAASLIDDYGDLARQLGDDRRIERFFFLGSGALYGIASEAMLKMKEMSLSYSEAYHVLEFRHGPMSMVDERALVVGLLSDEAHAQEAAVLTEMRKRGAQILALGEQDYGLELARVPHFVRIGSTLPRWARPVTFLPVLQLLAYHRALSNGHDPDRPANLTFVIALDQSMM
ncbi:MAG: SIS domain-containing protein [Chloroflexota bacterium]|nr:SIS domain-containing protein [Chloroflexota bacterium]